MADDTTKTEADASKGASKPAPKKSKVKRKPAPKAEREQSTIAFSYLDLDAAITVARAIINAGGVPVTRDQLAGAMNLVAGGGNFVLRVATARLFGLIDYTGGKYALTNIGFSIVDQDEKRQRAARAEAFLNVPLYKRAYEEFRGKQLPPRPHGLEQAFVKFGVPPKRKANARLAFDKSAQQAGFFPNGPDRLIEPILGAVGSSTAITGGANVSAEASVIKAASNQSASEALGDEYHPFIQGLLDTLPEPNTNWTVEGRAKWLQAAANIFDLIYKGTGEITVHAKPAHESEK